MDRKVGVFVLKIPVPFTYGGVENNLLSRDTAAPCHRGSGVASKVGSIGMRLRSESTREVEAPCCRAATVAAVLSGSSPRGPGDVEWIRPPDDPGTRMNNVVRCM